MTGSPVAGSLDGPVRFDSAAPPLRIALLSYRSKPHCGGQGVYVRHLARELAALGHHVTVVSGPPYPELDPSPEPTIAGGPVADSGRDSMRDSARDHAPETARDHAPETRPGAPRARSGRVELVRLPSLDLYREPDPFRLPHVREYRDWIDVLEVATMLTAGFGEPRTFSLRAARWLAQHGHRFDVVHDNQTLGDGLLAIARRHPLVTTIHHPISRDRRTDLAAARGWRRLSLRRWYGFVRMQARVARRLPHVLTVSGSSARDIAADFGVAPDAIEVVPLGVDTALFAPGPARVPGRVVAMASADTPLKGIDTLLEAVADLPAVRELVLVATPGERTRALVARFGLGRRVRFVAGISDADLGELIASAQVACVPSRYEGFSLPAVEALACGTPVVASRAGALPEVLGDDGRCARLVPPGDPAALRAELADLLADDAARAALGAAGRALALQRYSWPAVARATVAAYRRAIGDPPAIGPRALLDRPAAGVAGSPADRPAGDPTGTRADRVTGSRADRATLSPAHPLVGSPADRPADSPADAAPALGSPAVHPPAEGASLHAHR